MKKLLIIIVLFISGISYAQFDSDRISIVQDYRLSYENPGYESLYGADYGQDWRKFTLGIGASYKMMGGWQSNTVLAHPFFSSYVNVTYDYAQLIPEYHRVSLGVGVYHKEGRVWFYVDAGYGMIIRSNVTYRNSYVITGQMSWYIDDHLAVTAVASYVRRTDIDGRFIFNGSIGFEYKLIKNGK